MPRVWRRIAYLLRRRQLEAELSEELEFHRMMTQDRHERDGTLPADAAGTSRRALGNVTLAREDAHFVWTPAWLEHTQQDVRYAVRMMRKHPAFAAALVFLMAMGIGTTTTVFSLVNSLVLKPLPVHDPERLVWFGSPSFSYPIFQEVRARSAQMFSSVAAWDVEDMYVDWGGGLEAGQVLLTSGNFHSTLGIKAALGRALDDADDTASGTTASPAAVISYECWRRRFGGSPSALGATVRVNRVPFTIVGVMPRSFFGVAPGLAPEVTLPATVIVQLREDERDALRSRSSSWLHLIARLRPEVSLAQANAMLRTVWPAVLEATFPPGMDRREHFLTRTTTLEPGRSGFSRVRRQFAEPLWMLFALVMLLLLVACASAANLLLARSMSRRRELATRLAIGAGRGRIVRQLLTESAVWILLGAVAAFLVTRWAGEAVVAMLATRGEPVALDLEPDWRIFAFTAALTLAAIALVALLPSIRAARIDPAPALKSGNLPAARLQQWTAGRLLVVAEVALTVLLLAGAALFVRSLLEVLGEDAGFDREHLLVVSTDPIAAGYQGRRVDSFRAALVERLAAIPGVRSVALSLYPPISDEDGAWTQNIWLDGAPVSLQGQQVFFNVVSHQFFETLGMRMLRGRGFTSADDEGSERVVVINAALAQRLFGQEDALGRRLSVGRDTSRQNLTIIGVVQNAKYQTLQEPSRGIAYVPARQGRERLEGENLFATIRMPASHQSSGESIRGALVEMEPAVPVRVERVTDRIRDSLVRERTIAVIATVLGAAAVLLACAAVYGLIAYTVSMRTSEIGIRLAFGARRGSVLWMVLRDTIAIGVCGVAAGVVAALLFGGVASSLLYRITPSDPVSLAAAAAAMLVVTGCAGLLPAARAARLDPVAALRE